ncbi:MAG: hypothetical protein ACLP05_09325 [Candidatus Kryptoniota bacterium]
MKSFARHFAPKHPRDLNEEDARRYLIHLVEDNNLTSGRIGQIRSPIGSIIGPKGKTTKH